MSERVSATTRVRLQSQAETVLQQYNDNNALWFKNVTGLDLDPLQILRMDYMDTKPNTVAWDARRMRKSTTTFLHALKAMATEEYGELCAITPREAQAQKSLNEYVLDVIRGSEILISYLEYKSGRRQLSDTTFQFANKSKGWISGIMSEVDGSGLTYAIMDEIEDMDYDRLVNRFLPMLGQTEKLGSTKKTKPQVRALGVIKGSGIRKEFIDRGFFPITQPNYPEEPIIGNVYLGMEMGILNPEWMEMQRKLMAPDDWRMQMLCQEVDSTNVIHLKWARRAMTLGKKLADGSTMGEMVEPMPGMQYKRHGIISLGYDHLGHGEKKTSSGSALVIAEMIGEHVFFPYVKWWPSWTDETEIMQDILSIWRYFMPDVANGDALGIGMITAINDALYKLGLTQIDRLSIGNGESTSSTWDDWAFSPMRFLGEMKHKMAQVLQTLFRRYLAVIPWYDNYDVPEDGIIADFHRFFKQLCNVTTEHNKNGAYPKYVIDDKQIGDDFFDAVSAAVWGLATRYVQPSSIILTSTTNRDQALLGNQTMRQRILGNV